MGGGGGGGDGGDILGLLWFDIFVVPDPMIY